MMFIVFKLVIFYFMEHITYSLGTVNISIKDKKTIKMLS